MTLYVRSMLLAAAVCSASISRSTVSAASEKMVQTSLEYEGHNCQGTPIMQHITTPGRQGKDQCQGDSPQTASGAAGLCKKTLDGTSSYTSLCEAFPSDWQAPSPGFLCRVMYEQSPDCNDPSAVKQVDCFTLTNLGKCWSRSVSGFSVTPEPDGAGVSARTMRLAFDDGSVTSGQQYSGPMNVKAPEESKQTVEAFSSQEGSACNTGGCTCSSITVRNGECDGFGTKYVW